MCSFRYVAVRAAHLAGTDCFKAENLDEELRKYTGEKPLTEDETAGTELWSFPLSSWAYYYKLRQMEWIIQLGFELEIYHTDELSGMYWYEFHNSSQCAY